MEPGSQSLDTILRGIIRFASRVIPPLGAWLRSFADKYAARALDSYERADLSAATQDYETALVWNPTDPALHSALGQICYEQRETDKAEKHFRKALNYDYQNLRALKGLALLLLEREAFADAMYYYFKCLELEQKDAAIYHNLGVALYNLGNYQDALDYYAKAEQLEPDDPLIHKNRSLTLLALGRYQEAQATLLRARELTPDDGEVDRLLGSAVDGLGESEHALQCYTSALEKDSEDPYAHMQFASVASRLERYADAAKHARRAGELLNQAGEADEAAEAYWDLGWNYYKLGDLNASLEASTEAVRLNPKLAAVYFNIGLVLLQLGRPAEARKRYDDGIQNLTQLSDLKYYAIDDLREAIERNPNLAGASEILAVLEEKYAADSKDIAKFAEQTSAQSG